MKFFVWIKPSRKPGKFWAPVIRVEIEVSQIWGLSYFVGGMHNLWMRRSRDIAVRVTKHARSSLACFALGEHSLRAAYLGR
jgi:hypothetical protein